MKRRDHYLELLYYFKCVMCIRITTGTQQYTHSCSIVVKQHTHTHTYKSALLHESQVARFKRECNFKCKTFYHTKYSSYRIFSKDTHYILSIQLTLPYLFEKRPINRRAKTCSGIKLMMNT